ncbi:hypothetical protein B5F15_08495 [Butyricicoccus pullicaecorum]|uniref:Uncharacterized protein n=1 Tax=Butyricicoccus pullicaecorum TaxID=501571 RepID=A0A1Y4LMB1_9FIRM|nr:hypothetical protein B5F15_08495 [Butyricicoccus pullicaecorum]
MGQFVPRSFSFPRSRLLGFIPRRRLLHGMAGRCPSRVHGTAALRRLALYGRPGCAIPGGVTGAILQSRPLSHEWERAGGIGLNTMKRRFSMKRPLAYITAAWCGEVVLCQDLVQVKMRN